MESDDVVGGNVFGVGLAGQSLSELAVGTKDLEGAVISYELRAAGDGIASKSGIVYAKFSNVRRESRRNGTLCGNGVTLLWNCR